MKKTTYAPKSVETIPADVQQEINRKAQAIAEAINILEMRIRFNAAIIEFAETAPDLDFVEQSSRKYKRVFKLEEAGSFRAIELRGAKNDYTRLNVLLTLMKQLKVNPDDHITMLKLVHLLHVRIEREKIEYETTLQSCAQAHREALTKLTAARRTPQNKKALQDAEANLAKVKHSNDNCESINKIYTEYQTYLKLKALLDAKVFPNLVKEFISIYTETTFIDIDGDVCPSTIFSSAFNNLCNKNKKEYNLIQQIINKRHSELKSIIPEQYDTLKTTFSAEQKLIPELDIELVNKVINKTADYNQIFNTYLSCRLLPDKAKELDVLDKEICNELENWAKEIADAQLAEQAEMQKLEENLKQAEKQEKLLELQRLKELKEAEIIARNEAKKERLAEYNLKQQRKRQEREAESIKYRIALRKSHNQAFEQANTVSSDKEGKGVISKFKVTEEVVINNTELLLKLFDTNTRTFRYRDVESLLNKLNGQLVTDTASSHQYIVFGGTKYQEVALDEDDSEELVKPLARPHSTCLNNYNLVLLRNAVASVMPENWISILEKHKKPGVSLKLPRCDRM